MTVFRTATLAELRVLLDWAAAEGWNPGLDDAEAFFAADPDGFFVAERAGEMVAGISVVTHAPDFAFLGLYIAAPDARGQGIGYGLWQHAMGHAGARVVGLDGVAEQQANYARSDFARAGGTTRLTGALDGREDETLRRAEAAEIPALIAREASASGVAKPAYLDAWFTGTETRITLIDAGETPGFCTVRACREGAKIGPLVASSTGSARRLILHAAARFPGPITLDVPDSGPALTALCHELGLTPGFRTARMYRGRAPAAPADLFAVTSLELG